MANGRVSYNGRERYEKLMVFGGVPVYSTNSDILVTKADVACCLDRAIVIRTEALEAFEIKP